MTWWQWIVLAVLAAAAVYAIVACVCVLLVTLVPHRRSPETHPDRFRADLPAGRTHPLRLTCSDGVAIDACLVSPGPDAAVADPPLSVVLLHGISDCKERLAELACELADAGLTVLLLDFRGHGRSGGRLCTYGYYERRDVRAAVDWLAEHVGGPVGVYGQSLGGAVALLAGADDARIGAVAAEGAYARLRQIIGDYAARRGAMRWLNGPAVYGIERVGRFRADDCDPIDAAAALRVPVLLIHGLADRHVRADYSRQLAARLNGQSELWLVPKAPHSRCREVAGAEYARRLADFFIRSLAKRPAEDRP